MGGYARIPRQAATTTLNHSLRGWAPTAKRAALGLPQRPIPRQLWHTNTHAVTCTHTRKDTRTHKSAHMLSRTQVGIRTRRRSARTRVHAPIHIHGSGTVTCTDTCSHTLTDARAHWAQSHAEACRAHAHGSGYWSVDAGVRRLLASGVDVDLGELGWPTFSWPCQQ